MQAVILAGGLGTRLRPLTNSTPKPLIPLKGKPFLDYLIEILKKNGFTEVIICSSYLSEKFRDYYKNGQKFGIKITHSIESTPLGTAGAIKNASFYLKDTFFVINGDTYLDIDYKDLYEKFSQSDKIAAMVVYTGKENWERQNDTQIENGIVASYDKGNKKMNYIWAGVMLLRKSVLSYIRSATAVTLEDEIFPKLVAERNILAYETKVRYYDIGTQERIKKFEEFLNKGAKNDNK